ncbi:MAG TPA: hypothetical protein DGH68_12135 [Bacteroidetes bacterium]|jgi:hypothetical protein|nr:hypothetical protein [Bacteroidota bacterium]
MKSIYGLFFLVVVFSSPLYAIDTVYVASGIGTLNTAVDQNIADLNSKAFKLEPFGLYILTATITVPAGQHLRVVADDPGTTQQTAPPQIMWTPSSGVNTRFNFDCNGDITMKNIWLTYMTTDGAQVGSSLQFEDNLLSDPERGTFEGCIFDYAPCPQNAGGTIGVSAPHFVGTFKNCYFRNNTDSHFRYYGRAVSFPFGTTGWHTDSLYFVNCTFANMGYVYMQEGAEYADFVWFNHCTFLNSVVFTLESGWWWWLNVTNSVYVNAFMFGDFLENTSQDGDYPNGGAVRIDSISQFGFSVPFTEVDRHIVFAHNSYYIEQWLQDYMDHGNPYSDTAGVRFKPHPQPMMSEKTRGIFGDNVTWPHMSMFNNYDNTNPNFLLAPTNIDRIKIFLLKKWTDNSDMPWAFDTASTINGTWPLGENLKYSNTTLRSAGMGGFPLGDLYHWFKSTHYASWQAQEATENGTIMDWLNTQVVGVQEVVGLPTKVDLGQNYPNPFNPTTRIDYSVPQSGYVSLKVYNLLGKEVATLVAGRQEPGTHYAYFDGQEFPTGVYFYRLQTDQNSITRKLVLMK